MMDKLEDEVIWWILLLLTGFIIGICSTELYHSYSRDVNGIWINGTYGEARAEEIALKADAYGNFVCININGMTIKDIQSTCVHESLHEVWAEHCTKNNLDECINVIETVKGERL